MKSSRFSIYSLPGHILSQLLRYQEVFSWESFRERDRYIAFFVPNNI